MCDDVCLVWFGVCVVVNGYVVYFVVIKVIYDCLCEECGVVVLDLIVLELLKKYIFFEEY